MSLINFALTSQHSDQPIAALVATLMTMLLVVFTQVKGKRTSLVNIFSLHTACIGLWVFGIYELTIARNPMEGLFWARFLNAAALFIPCTFFHFVSLLINQKERLRDQPLVIIGYCVSIVILMISPSNYFIKGTVIAPGYHYYPDLGKFYFLMRLVFAMFVGWGHIKLFKAYSKASGVKKNQFKYVFVGYFIGYFGGAQTFLPGLGLRMMPDAMYGLPIGLGILAYAIVEHRLMDISVIIRKTLVYSTVMGGLTVIYLCAVAIFARLFQGLTGYQTVFSSAMAAGLITFCFQPLRKKIQTIVDSKFFREYVDREEKLYELSREVITHTTPEAMAQSLIRVLADTMHPKSAALYLRARDGNGFVQVSRQEDSSLPERMPESNPLTNYFMDHPQPFVQDLPSEMGETLDTRRPARKEDAA